MLKSLDEIRREIEAVNNEAEWLCDGFDENQLAWRPSPDTWSIAENLEHLNLTTETFIPVVDRAIEDGRYGRRFSEGPYELGMLGRIYLWYVEPPPKLSLGAPAMLKPMLHGPAIDTFPQFIRSQEIVLQLIDRADGLDCAGIRFRSPLWPRVSMNLIAFFAVVAGHQRRHLAQAARVKTLIAPKTERDGSLSRPEVKTGTYAE